MFERLRRQLGGIVEDEVFDMLERALALTTPSNLMQQLNLIPLLHAYFASVQADLLREEAMLAVKHDRWESELRLMLRESKITLKEVEAQIKIHPEYEERQREVIELQSKITLVKQLLAALQLKGELLVQQGAQLRFEAAQGSTLQPQKY